MIKGLPAFKFLTTGSALRKQSLVWALKFGILFVVFLVFFFPVQRDAGILSSNMDSLKDQIEDLKKISLNLLTPEELKETEQRVNEFKFKLIDSARVNKLLDFISDEADKNHFNVIQIYSDSPITLKDDQGKELELDGKKLMLLPVNFRVETDFKSLGNFLKSLKDNTQGNFVIESLSLKKTTPQMETLQCDLTLSFVAV